MKIHRFYVGVKRPREIQQFGAERCWLQDSDIRHQWQKVLRFRENESVSLFDDNQEIIYKIVEFKTDEIELHKVSEVVPKKAEKKTLLAWSLLKKDNNDLVLQKATELGVTHLVPLVSERSEKTGFDSERALKIAIEAAEQCGRIDIPLIEEPLTPEECIIRFKENYVLHIADERFDPSQESFENAGALIGPEGGWSEKEFELFEKHNLNRLHLGAFTLRAETAAVIAVSKLVN